jgi:hypothetical protein
MKIMWHVDPLLDSDRDRERTSYKTAVTTSNSWKQQQRNGVLYAVRAKML